MFKIIPVILTIPIILTISMILINPSILFSRILLQDYLQLYPIFQDIITRILATLIILVTSRIFQQIFV